MLKKNILIGDPVPKLIDCAPKAQGFGPGYKSGETDFVVKELSAKAYEG
jgi:hypothetical protein